MTAGASFKDARVLIVGGAGFVGSSLARALLAQEPEELIIVDNLLSSEAGNVPRHPRARFLCGSITEPRILRELRNDLDYVFQLACYHGNQSSIADPEADHANNAYPNLVLFSRLASFNRLKKVVYAAAGCAVAEKTFGEAGATPEDAPVSLFHDSPYSISKIIGEMYGNYFFLHDGLPLVRARFQNVYGPGEILGAGRWRGTVHTVWRNVIPTFIWKALNREALPLDNEGRAGRDFIFVEDIARGLMACALRGEPGEAYNLASGSETSIFDLAGTINDLTGNTTPVSLLPARDWDRSGHRFGSPEKAREKLEFAVRVPLREGLEQTIIWTRANREMIAGCMARHEPLLSAAQGRI
jgi:nucleoside-diphosphate-sugar epimerase